MIMATGKSIARHLLAIGHMTAIVLLDHDMTVKMPSEGYEIVEKWVNDSTVIPVTQ